HPTAAPRDFQRIDWPVQTDARASPHVLMVGTARGASGRTIGGVKIAPIEYGDRKVYSVAAFNRGVADWLARLPTLWVEGEVTELRRHTGWQSVFFTLKDPSDGACLPVTMPRGRFEALRLDLADGERCGGEAGRGLHSDRALPTRACRRRRDIRPGTACGGRDRGRAPRARRAPGRGRDRRRARRRQLRGPPALQRRAARPRCRLLA